MPCLTARGSLDPVGGDKECFMLRYSACALRCKRMVGFAATGRYIFHSRRQIRRGYRPFCVIGQEGHRHVVVIFSDEIRRAHGRVQRNGLLLRRLLIIFQVKHCMLIACKIILLIIGWGFIADDRIGVNGIQK